MWGKPSRRRFNFFFLHFNLDFWKILHIFAKIDKFFEIQTIYCKTDWYENKRGKNRKHQKAYQEEGKHKSETPIVHQQTFERG